MPEWHRLSGNILPVKYQHTQFTKTFYASPTRFSLKDSKVYKYLKDPRSAAVSGAEQSTHGYYLCLTEQF